MKSTLRDLKEPLFWKSLLTECIGTCFLVLVGCGSCIGGWDPDYQPTIVQIALCFGLIVSTMVWSIAHISGGHINPAVTVAMLLTRKITPMKSIFYILSQCIGAVIGAGILKGVTPADMEGALGTTTLHPSVSQYEGFGVEFCITFVLVFTVFATVDESRKDFLHGSRALAIGLSVTVCHLFAVSSNPENKSQFVGNALLCD